MRATSPNDFRLPDPSHKLAIYGRTGTGKTVLGSYALSQAPFDRMPYYVLDFKRDDLLNSTKWIERVSLRDKITKYPGVYIIHANPGDEKQIEDFLWRVRAARRTGLFVDEGYMQPLPSSDAYNAILTQGRSLQIPVINLTQRPVWLSRFVVSQSDFHALFPFSDDRDNETVTKFFDRDLRDHIENGRETGNTLPKHHCYWQDIERQKWFILRPCPPPETITQIFEDRLKPRKTRL